MCDNLTGLLSFSMGEWLPHPPLSRGYFGMSSVHIVTAVPYDIRPVVVSPTCGDSRLYYGVQQLPPRPRMKHFTHGVDGVIVRSSAAAPPPAPTPKHFTHAHTTSARRPFSPLPALPTSVPFALPHTHPCDTLRLADPFAHHHNHHPPSWLTRAVASCPCS